MTEKHTHKLKRLKYRSGNIVFFCALPDCSFKTNIALALGKRSLCWRCGKDFLMSEYCLRLAKPHCEACHKTKKIEESIEEILPKMNISIPITDLAERLQQTIKRAQASPEEDEI